MLTERERRLLELLRKNSAHVITRNTMAMQAVKENTVEAYQQFFVDIHEGEIALLGEIEETLARIQTELGYGRHT